MNYHTLPSLRVEFKSLALKIIRPQDSLGIWATSKDTLLEAVEGQNPVEAVQTLKEWLAYAEEAESSYEARYEDWMEDAENHIRYSY